MSIDITTETLRQLTRIADALEILANGGEERGPEMRRPLGEYSDFDWESIGAQVVQQDKDGASLVEWNGKLWTRRTGYNPKFGAAIWFSRGAGHRDDNDQVKYLTLIKFQPITPAEPLPEKVAGMLASAAPAKPNARDEYLAWAAGDLRQVKEATASWILDKCGGNIEQAKGLIPLVAEALNKKLDKAVITSIMVGGDFNLAKCRQLLYNSLHPQKEGAK